MEKWLQKLKACEQFTKDDAKELVNEVRKNYDFNKFSSLPENTQLDYAKKANRLLKQGITPLGYCKNKGLKRSTYHAYRAAFIHVLLYELEKKEKIQSYIKYLIQTLNEQYQKEFRYKPNKARISQYIAKGNCSKEKAIQRDKAKQEKAAKKQSKTSKKSSLKGLPGNWRILVEEAISQKYKGLTYILHLAGYRPAEIEKGIKYWKQGGILTINIQCAKHDPKRNKGIPERTIEFDMESNARAAHIGKQLEENKIYDLELPEGATLASYRQAYGRAAVKALGKRPKGREVSLYSARHQFKSDLQFSEINKKTIAYLMGHAWNPRIHELPNGQYVESHLSQGKYGHKSQGMAGNTSIISEDNELDIRLK